MRLGLRMTTFRNCSIWVLGIDPSTGTHITMSKMVLTTLFHFLSSMSRRVRDHHSSLDPSFFNDNCASVAVVVNILNFSIKCVDSVQVNI